MAGQTAPREASGKPRGCGSARRWQEDGCARKGPHSGRPTRVLRSGRETPGLDLGGLTGAVTGTWGRCPASLASLTAPRARGGRPGTSQAQPESAPRLASGHRHKREREPSLLPRTQSPRESPCFQCTPAGQQQWPQPSARESSHSVKLARAPVSQAGRAETRRDGHSLHRPSSHSPTHGEGRGTCPASQPRESNHVTLLYILFFNHRF